MCGMKDETIHIISMPSNGCEQFGGVDQNTSKLRKNNKPQCNTVDAPRHKRMSAFFYLYNARNETFKYLRPNLAPKILILLHQNYVSRW